MMRPYYGFISHHAYINSSSLMYIKQLVGTSRPDIVDEYELCFSSIVGSGKCVSYASGRMAFYDLMRIIGIGHGDEIILPGATCSVMVNAVLRVGAVPVFSDIDENTYGSSSFAIESLISPNTKLIVAQHSFGIPCDIDKIITIASKHDIFLLEDCALTLGSMLDGTVVGNFGDAALFSTDHSKPLNTITGGLIYTRDEMLAANLLSSRDTYDELPKQKQKALWYRFKLEKLFCNPQHYGKLGFIDLLYSVLLKLRLIVQPFLTNDYSSSVIKYSDYSYPSKIPSFLAQIGIYELERWKKTAIMRKDLFYKIKETLVAKGLREDLPVSYFDNRREICPLRFVWHRGSASTFRDQIKHSLNISWIWFRKPIVATVEPLSNFGYIDGDCPLSERVGKDIMNIPCNISQNDMQLLLNTIKGIEV